MSIIFFHVKSSIIQAFWDRIITDTIIFGGINVRRYIAFFLALMLMLSCFFGCGSKDDLGDGFTYNDYVSTLATNWNPHTYETATDNYPSEFLRMGFYSLLTRNLHKYSPKPLFLQNLVFCEKVTDFALRFNCFPYK